MNTKTKHALLDLREEINVNRDKAIKTEKMLYVDAKKTEAETHKQKIAEIKAQYADVFKAQKAEMIIAIETSDENEEV